MRILLSLMLLVLVTNLSSKEPLWFAVGGSSPMFIENDDKLSGFDVEVITAVANDMGVEYDLHPMNFASVFRSMSNDTAFSAGIASITINSEREKNYNFTHPYKKSGLSILVRNEPSMDIVGALVSVFVGELFGVWVFFGIFVVIMGSLIHVAENDFKDFADGVWWTIVTSTTVGYGDLSPRTNTGRILAGITMLVGICTTGILIGSFSAVFNTQIVKYDINGIEDLKGKKIVTQAGTTSVHALEKRGFKVTTTDTLNEAVLLLEAKRVDALVFDDPQIRHIARENDAVTVVGDMFDRQDYGILLRKSDERLRKKMNQSILRLIENGTIPKLEEKYFGNR